MIRLQAEGFINVPAGPARPTSPVAPVAPVFSPMSRPPLQNPSPQAVTQACPGLSPVAAAAAAAADASKGVNDAKAAAIAEITSKVVADNLAPQMSDGINITCPSGENPVVNEKLMRNSKFTGNNKSTEMFDTSCGSNECDFDSEM